MATAYKPDRDPQIYAYLSGVWTDITADHVGDASGRWGISGNTPIDRLADPGSLYFSLINTTGKYTPTLPAALAGWGLGTPIKLVVTFESVEYIRFRGSVEAIDIIENPGVLRQVNVTVLDWMQHAEQYPLVNPGIQTNKTADQALRTIVPRMSKQPQATAYDTGINTFPALFDTVTTRTKAYTEFSKLVLAEVGYLYLTKDPTHGETLVFESNHHRSGLSDLSVIPVAASASGFLLKEDGGALLKEDGGKIILSETEVASFTTSMLTLDVVHTKEKIINRMTITAYPKRVDTSAQILYSLSSPMAIGSGQTITFKGNYTDPSGGATVNAISTRMIAPVATTDYLANTLSDGTGTNITSTLTVIAAYGTEAPTYTITNGSASAGFITLLHARGYGVYQYNPITNTIESAASQASYGYQDENLDQQYQRDLAAGSLEGQKWVEQNKNPRTVLNKIGMCANKSYQLMQAYLTLDVGDLVAISETRTGLDGWYYIQGGEFVLSPGGTIMFSWTVKQAFSLKKGLTAMGVEFGGYMSYDALIFGYLPHVCNLPARTMSAWIYIHSVPPYTSGIMGMFSDVGGNLLGVAVDGGGTNALLELYSNGFSTDVAGIWRGESDYLSLNTWYHVCATYAPRDPAANPIIYVDGTAIVLTETATPSGAPLSENNTNFVLGSFQSPTYPYTRSIDGLIKDARIYNRILTAGEVASLAAGGVVTDGLVFQAPCVRTSELTAYTDLTLNSETKMLDNIYGCVGTPNGAPIARTI